MKWLRGGLLACVFMALPVAAQDTSANAAKRFAGHYYLSGVMETGSELLLAKDGRFQWYISYGAMDQRAEGRWALQQDRIVLTSDAAGQGPWMRLKGSRDWDASADYSRARQVHEEQVAIIHGRCPFMSAGIDAASPAASSIAPRYDASGAEIKWDPAVLEADIRAQQQRLADYVTRAESAMASAMAAPESQREVAMQSATQAMSDYLGEQYALKDLYRKRRGPMPAYAKVALPAQCALPVAPERGNGPGTWKPGVAVFVHDDDAGAYYNDMPVTLVYADGHRENLITQNGGYAIAKHANVAMPTSIQAGDEQTRAQGAAPVLMEVPAGAKPVLELEFDPERMGGSAFERMELRVDGTDLVPNWEGRGERGRYER